MVEAASTPHSTLNSLQLASYFIKAVNRKVKHQIKKKNNLQMSVLSVGGQTDNATKNSEHINNKKLVKSTVCTITKH